MTTSKQHPPLGSLVYDEENHPMRVTKVNSDGTITLMYEWGESRGFYRVMGSEELQSKLCEPYPPGTYDVVVEIRGRKVVRVSEQELPALCMDMVEGTETPPIKYGEYLVYSMRPVSIVSINP